MESKKSKEIDILNTDSIIGSLLKGRYMIEKFLDQGSNGVVHNIIDKKHPSAKLVVKITTQYEAFGSEIKKMRRISKHSKGRFSTPEVECYGMAVQGEELMAWVIMPRYGVNLEYVCERLGYQLSHATIHDVGSAILTTLEAVHKAGYVFCDLKLDNLMTGYKQTVYKEKGDKSILRDCSLHLVDFGYSTKYLDSKKNHIAKKKIDTFRGNIIFGSYDQCDFYATSRKDDLISLCYILIYLLHGGKLLEIDLQAEKEGLKCLEIAKQAKKDQTIETLCYGPSKSLEKFVKEVFSLKFEQEPDYKKLMEMLSEALGQLNSIQEQETKSLDEMNENPAEIQEVKEFLVEPHSNTFK